MILGCIADDLTGATDLALMLSREGLRVMQSIGLPPADMNLAEIDAVVVGLKSRTIDPADAITLSLAAAQRLQTLGARHLFFKYCSTFDSTDRGNIGPVAEALLAFAGGSATIACPAFIATGRSVYCANLFVNGVPLNESPMKDHPLTPMRDANLVRVLQRQTAKKVAALNIAQVRQGAPALRAAFNAAREVGAAMLIVDAIADEDLRCIGAAFADLPLITGGSGVAMGLPAAYQALGLIARLAPPPARLAAPAGRRIVLAGSCSAATQGQVAHAIAAGMPSYRLEPLKIAAGAQSPETVLTWLNSLPADQTPLVYSTAAPEAVAAVQHSLGREQAGALVETLLAELAKCLPQHSVTRMIVAGGETSGAVVQALGILSLVIGPEIDPGAPWTLGGGMALALKSGNFGSPDFFTKAWSLLQ